MKLGLKIFICYFTIFIVCFFFPVNWVVENLRIRYLEGVEDPLVDQANILASIVGQDLENGAFDTDRWYNIFDEVKSREISARIYQFSKINVDMSIYITDKSGRVIFDSGDKNNAGKDYNIWRDVRLTLDGKYGARTTRKDPDDNKSSVLYVAAPIKVRGNIEGVLTIAKPTTNINNFIDNAEPRFLKVSLISLLSAVVLSLLTTLWIIRPINRLTMYAEDIRQGKRAKLPKLDKTEIGDMGFAFEKMKEALEGKKYVEQYVQTLTHEIKSPVSAIRGAAELLEEDMPSEKKDRFLANIRTEANRIQDIIDRMLELSSLENRKKLDRVENISLNSIIKTVLESKQPMLHKKNIRVLTNTGDDLLINGDSFLLNQAISNLLQNAIDFSHLNSQIIISISHRDDMHVIEITDEGPGIPDYALEKIFNKFFSLNRPDTEKKSTGLGLNFVREVAELHQGKVVIENLEEGGVKAAFIIPRGNYYIQD
ncbi:MAG: two-component system sensor histidine kinase CreC [Deltaproteobacteria bacterium]|nr:two-component system sensor histidine kinase CreC [Deltaproteobacteria bacterium]